MSTIKADNFTWKTGQATGQSGTNVTGDQIVYGVAKSWLNYSGQSYVVNKSFNISSVTYSSAGSYQANFSSAFVDAYYSITGGCSVKGANDTWLTAMSFGDTGAVYGARTTNAIGFFTPVQTNSKYDNNNPTMIVMR